MPNQYTGYPPLVERFWAKVQKTDTCWLWTGGTTRNGCGHHSERRNGVRIDLLTHRSAWEWANGDPAPPRASGLFVLHACDVRNCVRNDEAGVYILNGVEHPRFGHRWLGTNSDNMVDAANKGRTFARADWSAIHIERLAAQNRRRAESAPETFTRGEACWQSKLTEENVRFIRHHLAERTMTGADLARHFSVYQQTISAIRHRTRWKHVD